MKKIAQIIVCIAAFSMLTVACNKDNTKTAGNSVAEKVMLKKGGVTYLTLSSTEAMQAKAGTTEDPAFTVPVDINTEWYYQASTFTYRNSNGAYVDIADAEDENGSIDSYVQVTRDGKVYISVNSLDQLYAQPGINDSAIHTYEVYLWPNYITMSSESEDAYQIFHGINTLPEGYQVNNNVPRVYIEGGHANEINGGDTVCVWHKYGDYSPANSDYKVYAQVYFGLNGNDAVSAERYNYVKVSIHIAKRSLVTVPKEGEGIVLAND